MGRRSRRRRSSPSKANPRSYSGLRPGAEIENDQIVRSQSGAGPAVAEPPPQDDHAVAGKDQADWKTEYSRVFSDLKQLLIVSVALFAVMLVVGFFL